MFDWIRWLLSILVIAFSALLLTAPSSALAADDAPGTVRGTVHASDTKAPLPGATVSLRRIADSTLVDGTTTDSTGRFAVDDLPLGRYHVRVRFVGYAEWSRSIRLTETAPTRTLSPIRLDRATSRMDNVEVSANRPFMTTEGSKKVYDFGRTLVALAGKSAADALRTLPSLRITHDGSIRLRGNGNVSIHLNGKPAAMEGKALVQYLKSLSAEDVERVEVTTNPSARHDAEGTAGIINIVLDRADHAGWSGGLSASGGLGPRFSGSGNLGYKKEPWTIHGSYSYRSNHMDRTQTLLRRRQGTSPTTLLNQLAREDFTFGGHNFTTQVDYALTPKTTLSMTSTGSFHGTDETRSAVYRQTEPSDASPDRKVEDEHGHWTLDERLSATHTFDSDNHEVSVDLRYQMEDQYQSFREEKTRPSAPRERGREDETGHDATVEVDYTRPAGPWTVETGYKGAFRHLTRSFGAARFDAATGRFAALSERSSAFTFEEQVQAAYGILQRELGPVDAEVGLRFEHTRTTVDPSDDAPFDNRYAGLFPSASLTYKPSKTREVSLSYSKRVNRPSVHQLSSFGALSNPHVRFVGNPTLEPEDVHKVELTLVQHAGPAMITLSPYGQRTVNSMDWTTTVRSDSLTVRTYDNYDASTSYGVEFNSSVQVGDTFQGSLSGNVYRMKTRGGTLRSGVTRDAFAVSGRATATWTIRSGLRLQTSHFYRSPIHTGIGHMDAYHRTEASIEHSLWDDRGTLGLRVQDPFDASEMGFQKRNQDIVERMMNDWDGRTLSLSFSYRFGDAERNHRNTPSSSGGGGVSMGGG